MILVTSAPSTAPSYLGSWSRKDLVSLGYPAAFCLGFYPDVDSWSHVAGALYDVAVPWVLICLRAQGRTVLRSSTTKET